ncbi:MAG: hypothetical protein U1F67_04910 [Rubrivivax sp.]
MVLHLSSQVALEVGWDATSGEGRDTGTTVGSMISGGLGLAFERSAAPRSTWSRLTAPDPRRNNRRAPAPFLMTLLTLADAHLAYGHRALLDGCRAVAGRRRGAWR